MVGVGDILSFLVDLLDVVVKMLSVDDWVFVFVLVFYGFCSNSEEIVGRFKFGGLLSLICIVGGFVGWILLVKSVRLIGGVIIVEGRKGTRLEAIALGEVGLLVKLRVGVVGLVFLQ